MFVCHTEMKQHLIRLIADSLGFRHASPINSRYVAQSYVVSCVVESVVSLDSYVINLENVASSVLPPDLC